MPKIFFENEQLEVEVPAGTTILEAATAQGIFLRRSALDCGGRGLPGCSCRVWVRARDGRVNPKTFWEKLPFRAIHGEVRLACQTRVQGDVTVITSP